MDTLQNGYLARYLDSNLKLAKTMVIKLEEAADLINEGVTVKYGTDAVDLNNPASWKYYKNLSGQYHATDTMMRVVSIDTLETIDFTLENLQVHTATAAAFAYGTRYYNSLVAQYPTQETLINGILTPVDVQKAITAKSGDILVYPEGLVEENEVTLISDLELYLKRVIARWFNVQFAMSDNLYLAVFFTMLSTFVYPKLLNLRLARCKTPEVHSFHVRMYLASHLELDQYLPYLSLKQSLWLYRNIAYLERHPGLTSQFQTLVTKLLTERGIPLGEYSIRHLDGFDEAYMPQITARLKWISGNENSNATEYQTPESVFEKELDLAIDNSVMLTANQGQYLEDLKTSASSVIQTKMLTSAMVDYSNAIPETFEEVALRQWCYMALHGLYPVSIRFKDPTTSVMRTLFAKDAFLYLYYLELRSSGLTLDVFPDYLNMQQRRHPKPSVDDLMSVVDQTNHDLRDIAVEVHRRQPTISTCYSVSAFYKLTKTIFDEAYWHWFLISSMQDHYERAMVDNMIRRLYEDVRATMSTGYSSISEWLVRNNLPEYDMTLAEAEELMKVVYEAATGQIVEDAKVLRNIQKAMLDIVSKLSSYTIQLTRSINAEDIISVNWPAERLGQLKASEESTRCVPDGISMIEAFAHSDGSLPLDPTSDVTASCMGSPGDKVTPLLLADGIQTTTGVTGFDSYEDVCPTLTIDFTYEGQDVELENKMLLPGYTTFDRLPSSLKSTLKAH